AQLHEQRLDEPGVAPLVHAREGPSEHAWRLGRVRAVLRRRREADELREQPALPDAGLARDEHDLGVTEARRLVREIEPGQLHPSSDERRRDVDGGTYVGALAGERVHEDGLVLALELDRSDL